MRERWRPEREYDRCYLRPRGILWVDPADHNRELTDLPRYVVYNDMPAVAIDPSITPTMETRRQADKLWPRLALRGRKLADKHQFFHCLFHAGKRAWHQRGVIRYSRHLSQTSRAHLEVIDAAVAAGLFASYKSPPGSPKMSRLVPLFDVAVATALDPWAFDPQFAHQYVYLRERGPEKRELSFDPTDPVPARVQRQLEVVNAVNADCEIVYDPYDVWADCLTCERRLRPIHYAIFTDDWHHHGRIYTGRYGHQGLRRLERQTIRFDEEQTVELDYAGFHTRMLYHLRGIEYRGDPYELWGPDWGGGPKKALRLMAKAMVNSAINAPSRESAVSACNQQMNPRTAEGDWKSGRAAHTASRLRQAVRETGVKFADIYELAQRVHSPIKDAFGSDAGMRLMNLDGAIALDVLFHFASKGVPCLGLHDSFVVPLLMKGELKRVMKTFYEERMSFWPVVG
jgi:hypothetical protein